MSRDANNSEGSLPHGEVLYSIISQLQAAHIFITLQVNRDDAITIAAVVPGQIWEIDVFQDGTVDLEVFRSDGKILNRDALNELVAQFTD